MHGWPTQPNFARAGPEIIPCTSSEKNLEDKDISCMYFTSIGACVLHQCLGGASHDQSMSILKILNNFIATLGGIMGCTKGMLEFAYTYPLLPSHQVRLVLGANLSYGTVVLYGRGDEPLWLKSKTLVYLLYT